MPSPIGSLVQKVATRLRYPQLFAVVLVLFLVDLVLPDAIPFVDEILFGLLTVILGSLRREPDEGDEQEERTVKDVTPRE